ncbi:MAG: hypothetical protein HZC51_07675 [Nitrospirae bacterium]|nr:hypothetical protein [Nitrospirota bacterium]
MSRPKKSEDTKAVEELQYSLDRNLKRVDNLVSVSMPKVSTGRGRKSVEDTDVLRAAVVLLHASLDDFLRSIAILRLPKSTNSDVLEKYSLLGSKGNKEQQLNLKNLFANRTKSINDYITDSIESYLDLESFNRIKDITDLFLFIGISNGDDAVKKHFTKLNEMMERRHNIVHRADKPEITGRGIHHAVDISPYQVKEWSATVKEFSDTVLKCISAV